MSAAAIPAYGPRERSAHLREILARPPKGGQAKRKVMPKAETVFGPEPALVTDDRLTEAGAAERFAREQDGQICYDHRRNRWLMRRPHRWEPDASGEIYRVAMAAVLDWQHDALALRDARVKAAVLTWATSFDRRAKLESLLALGRCLEPLADDGARWDADPWLLGCPNGVVDLKTGTLRPGRPEDTITMQTGTPFDSAASAPRWEQFLTEIFPDPAVLAYVWLALGYSLTGDMREQCFFLLNGRGRNGKSTLIDTVSYVLGDYGHPTPFSAFEQERGGAIPVDVAALDGKRLVTASETNGRWLHAPRLKDITGGERMTVRHLYGHPFTFRPSCKIWLSVNELPRIADDSDGLWRRLKEIPFTRQFEGAADDRSLKDTLRAEAPGILASLVRACLAWQESGLTAPDPIATATNEYRHDSDPLGRFIEEACDLDTAAEVGATELYRHYQSWAERAGLNDGERLTAIGFGRKVAGRFRRVRTHSGPVFCGICRRGV